MLSTSSNTTTTETVNDGQKRVVGRDKLEYASLTDVLLGQPIANYRNNSIQTKRSHGWSEESIDSWIAWLEDGLEKGHLTKDGEYVATTLVEKDVPLPPPGPRGIEDLIGIDWIDAKDKNWIFKCDVDAGIIGIDRAVERRRRRLQLLYAAGRRSPF